jgi:hypothetical protein
VGLRAVCTGAQNLAPHRDSIPGLSSPYAVAIPTTTWPVVTINTPFKHPILEKVFVHSTLPPSCAVVMKSGKLNFLEPSGPLQACNGTALPFLFVHSKFYAVSFFYYRKHCTSDGVSWQIQGFYAIKLLRLGKMIKVMLFSIFSGYMLLKASSGPWFLNIM